MRTEMMNGNTMRFLKTERNDRCTKRKETFNPCLLIAFNNINIPKEEKETVA